VSDVVKKKVKPYPFDAELELNSLKKPVEVIYVGRTGAIVRLKAQLVFVGEYYQMTFSIPVIQHVVTVKVRVIKTYDKSLDLKDRTVERLAELLFQGLTQEHYSRIVGFMNAIGQEK